MWDWRNEWALLKAAIPEFESFLFSDEIYWSLSFKREGNISPQFNPRLSVGRLEISIYLLQFFSSQDTLIEAAVSGDLAKIQAIKLQWKSNWSKKAAREFNARIRQWQQVVREIRTHAISIAEYQSQVQVRLMLTFLEETSGLSAELEEQSGLITFDQILRGNSISSDFIWADEIKSAFPPEKYWFLYRSLSWSGE